MDRLLDFLDRLDKNKIHYRLNKVRDGIMIEIAIPNERWEVEFMRDGSVEIEKFKSSGAYKESELEVLFPFSDETG